MSDFLDQVKEISVLDVFESYCPGQELRSIARGHSCCSPFREDVHPSFQIFEDTNSWYDYGTGEGGSAIDLVMKASSLDFWEAATDLARRFGIPLPNITPEEKKKQKQDQNRQALLDSYITHVCSNLGDEHRDALRRRGLTDEMIAASRIGYDPRQFNQPSENAAALGLLSGKGAYLPAGRMVIPIFDHGKPIYAIFWDHHHNSKSKLAKYLFPNGLHKPLIGLDTVRADRPAYLVEGIFDWLSMRQASPDLAAVCCLGTKLDEKKWAKVVRASRVYILFDNDDKDDGTNPGQKAAEELAWDFYPQARNILLPSGKDPADLFVEDPAGFAGQIFKLSCGAKDAFAMLCDELSELLKAGKKVNEHIKGACRLIARHDSATDRAILIQQLAGIIKPIGVNKANIEADVEAAIDQAEESGASQTVKKRTDVLVELACENAIFFRDNLDDIFSYVQVNDHGEVLPIMSRAFRRWLVGKYYAITGESPQRDSVNEALGVIEAKAVFEGEQRSLSLRVAWHDGAIYYDLADPAWRAVKITADGWEIVDKPPIIFRRYQNTMAQVEPRRPGNLALLDNYLNLDENNKLLCKTEALSTFIPGIPHAIPTVAAEKGAGKSTQQCIRRRLIDPARQELASLPPDRNELALMLAHNYAPAFDNLSGLQGWQSDMLCTASTGGGISKRQLYTDSEEVFLSFQHCPALNGINCVATAPDLLDRAIILHMERINPDERREEADFWATFEADRPYILAGMFDALAGALRVYPTVKLKTLPRMADFTRWGYAIAEAAGLGGDKFLKAYSASVKAASDEAISGNSVAAAMLAFFENRTWSRWSGTPSQLLDALEKLAETERIDIRGKGWPKSANSLTRKINGLKSNLLDAGMKIEQGKSGDRQMIITPLDTENTVQAVQTVQDQEGQASRAGRYMDDIENLQTNTVQTALDLDDIDQTGSNTVQIPSNLNPIQDKHLGDTDDMDDILSTSGGVL
jgi:DNA primase